MSILDNIDLQSIDLKTPTSSSGSFYFTKLVLDANKGLELQLPFGNLKKDVNFMKRGDTFMNFNFESQSSDENNNMCLMLQNIEERIVESLFEKSSEWFENEISQEDIRDCLFGFLKFEKSGKVASIKVKLNIDKSNQSEILFKDGTNMAIEDLNSMDTFSPLVCVSGIKFNSKSFYIIMDLCSVQAQQVDQVEQTEKMEKQEQVESNVEIQSESNEVDETKTIEYGDETNSEEEETEQLKEEEEEEPLLSTETQEQTVENTLSEPEPSQVNDETMEEHNVDSQNQLNIDNVEEIEVNTENLEENISFDESKNILKLNENRILFYKLYMLFNEQIKTHQIDSILGKLGDMDVSYDKFIDFINNEDEEFYGEEKFVLN